MLNCPFLLDSSELAKKLKKLTNKKITWRRYIEVSSRLLKKP